MTSTYRADHVGSLLRPPELLQARQAFSEKRITLEQLRQIEDESILKALDLQRQAGVDVYTDGEYRRAIWYGPLSEGVEGIMDVQASPDQPALRGRMWQGRGGEMARETLAEVGGLNEVVGARLRRVGRMTGHEAAFLKQNAPGPWKMTIPGVTSRVGMWYRPGVTDKFYPTRADLINEFVGFAQQEVEALIQDGVSYIQLDSLFYVMQPSNAAMRQAMIDAGQDPDQMLAEAIASDNAVLEVAKRGGVTVGLHMCRGNNRSAWASAGSYEHLERAFNELKPDRFLLEYDTERAGGFEPLRFMPKDKVVILGLISSKEPEIESIDLLRRRIDEAAKYVPLQNLAISPQCGFASTAPGNLLTWDDQRRKLELVAETARKVWG